MANEEFSVVLFGDGEVGKTALIFRACLGCFVDDFDFGYASFRTVTKVNGEDNLLEFYPAPTDSEYHEFTRHIIRNADGLMIVYSVTDRASFESVKRYHDKVAELAAPTAPVIIVANKCDMVGKRVVSKDEGRALAKELGCEYWEVSAKEDLVEVDVLFRRLATSMVLMRRCIVTFPWKRPPRWKRVLGFDRTPNVRAVGRWLMPSRSRVYEQC